jgi:16S rRNA (guanine966-N2)-methyltransferase
MRIVGGALGGRRFGRPQPGTRPTSDRVREAVASVVASRRGFEGARVLELFAGTGAYAFEALSRGAERAVLVERDRRAAAEIERSAAELGLSDQITLLRVDLLAGGAERRLPPGPFDLLFVDPPYDDVPEALALLERMARAGLFAEDALVVLEHRSADAARVAAATGPNSPLEPLSRYRYGDTSIALLACRPEPDAGAPDEAQKGPPDA